MSEFRIEEDLREPVRSWILSQGLVPHDEVQMSGKVPDLIGTNGDDVHVAIELKLSNWQRALQQATIYTTFAKESYVAMPESKKKILEGNLAEFYRWGVGVLLVSGKSVRKLEREQNVEAVGEE